MAAIDQRFAWEGGEFHDRLIEHLERLLKAAAASHRKQSVSRKKHAFGCKPICDMPRGMARNLYSSGVERADGNAVTFANRKFKAADSSCLLCWPHDTGARKHRF